MWGGGVCACACALNMNKDILEFNRASAVVFIFFVSDASVEGEGGYCLLKPFLPSTFTINANKGGFVIKRFNKFLSRFIIFFCRTAKHRAFVSLVESLLES